MKLTEKQYNEFINNRLDIKEKQNKYHNKKVFYDGHWFDSIKERNRYITLKKHERLSIISELKYQVPFLLIDTQKINGKTYPKATYVADFTYKKDGKLYVEDVKSEITRKNPVYRLKIKILLEKYKDIIFTEEI